MTPTDQASPAPPQGAAPAPAKGKDPVPRIALIVVGALALLYLYHLVADRYTPYSSQATVDTFLVQIAPEISGPVTTVGVIDNQAVKKGQVLFGIDPEPFQIALKASEASLSVALQNEDSASADVRVADASLHRQRVDLAVSEELGEIVIDLADKAALAETAAIRARADIDKTRAEITRAEAEADRARIRLGDPEKGNPQVRQAQAALEQAKLDLLHSTVRAPADGAVTNLRLSPGQFVNRGAPVLSFVAATARWVTVDMRENQLGNIDSGDRALVTFDDRPGEVFPARVHSVGWGVTQGGETPNGQLPQVDAPTGWLREPQRFPVRIVLDPSDDPEKALPVGRSGAQASVVVLTKETSVMNPLARLWIWFAAKMSYLQ